MTELKDLFVSSEMKSQLIEIFSEIEDCMSVEEIIITKKNVAFTFKGYISSHDIQKLQQVLQTRSFIIRKHNYEKQEIIFTYNSELE